MSSIKEAKGLRQLHRAELVAGAVYLVLCLISDIMSSRSHKIDLQSMTLIVLLYRMITHDRWQVFCL